MGFMDGTYGKTLCHGLKPKGHLAWLLLIYTFGNSM